jgi:hypothetical protein
MPTRAHDGQTARTGGEETAQKRRSKAPTLKQAGQANLMRFVEELRRCNGNGKSVPRRFRNPFCLHDVRGSHHQSSLTIPSFYSHHATVNDILLTWPSSRPAYNSEEYTRTYLFLAAVCRALYSTLTIQKNEWTNHFRERFASNTQGLQLARATRGFPSSG